MIMRWIFAVVFWVAWFGSVFGQLPVTLVPVRVTNVAELVALKPPASKTVQTLGYWEQGDGGHGLYRWTNALPSGVVTNRGTWFAGVGGFWGLVNDGTVNVRQFGAKGDGVEDDADAIQSTVSSSIVEGYNVRFTSGNYLLLSSVVFLSPTRVRFDDSAVITLASSGFDYAGLAPKPGQVKPAIFSILSSDVVIEGFRMNGGTNQIASIKAGEDDYVSGSFYTNVVINGGVIVSSGAIASSSDTVTLARIVGGSIQNIRFESCRGKQAALIGCISSVIEGNTVIDADQGLYVGQTAPFGDNSIGCSVTGNLVENAHLVGMKLSRDSQRTTVARNTFMQNTRFPSTRVFDSSSGTDSVIRENLFYVNGVETGGREIMRIHGNSAASAASVRVLVENNSFVSTNSNPESFVYVRASPNLPVLFPVIRNNSMVNKGPTNLPIGILCLNANSDEVIVSPEVSGNYFEGFDLAITMQQTGSGSNVYNPLIFGNSFEKCLQTRFLEAENRIEMRIGDNEMNDSSGNVVNVAGPDAVGTNKAGALIRISSGRSTGSASFGNIEIMAGGSGISGTNINTAQRVATFHSGGLTIGDINPSASFALQIIGNSSRFADLTTDLTTKQYRFGLWPYNLTHQTPSMLYGVASETATSVNLGGGTSAMAAVTAGNLYAAAGNNTVTGTLIARWNTGGFEVLSGSLKANGSGLTVGSSGVLVARIRHGVATLVGGTVTVSDANVTANTRIMLTSQSDGGTPGWVRVSARTPSTSFTITSSSGTDTSTIAWVMFEP